FVLHRVLLVSVFRIDGRYCHRPRAAWIARQRRSGVAGISRWRMPSGERASISALPTAGSAPTLAASPAPLTPSGLVAVGTGLLSQSIAESVSARGIAAIGTHSRDSVCLRSFVLKLRLNDGDKNN